MKKLVAFTALVLSMMATIAPQASAVTWPAQCGQGITRANVTQIRAAFSCSNKHVNAERGYRKALARRVAVLERQMKDVLDNTPPANAVLQAQIDSLNTRVGNVSSSVDGLQTWRGNVHSCVGLSFVSQYLNYFYDASSGQYGWRSMLDLSSSNQGHTNSTGIDRTYYYNTCTDSNPF